MTKLQIESVTIVLLLLAVIGVAYTLDPTGAYMRDALQREEKRELLQFGGAGASKAVP